MREVVQEVWAIFMDVKFFLLGFAIAIVGGMWFGPSITSAIKEAKTEGYTGPAIVQQHSVVSDFCVVDVMYSGYRAVSETKIFGHKAACKNVTDGMKVKIVKGNIQH